MVLSELETYELLDTHQLQQQSDDHPRVNGTRVLDFVGGRYQMLERLKQGPDADVFLASDLFTGTKVVIKTAKDSFLAQA